jgi:hypothetical protein
MWKLPGIIWATRTRLGPAPSSCCIKNLHSWAIPALSKYAMIAQLLVAFGLSSVTVLVHALGTFEAIGQLARLRRQEVRPAGVLACEVQIVRLVSFLLLLHLIESAAWAGYYYLSGLLPDAETAMYFSLTSYTTIGYGDVVLPVQSRLLGPIEGGVGILTFGWSTAIMVAAIPRIYGKRLHVRLDVSHDDT